jgi:hypothetical protein
LVFHGGTQELTSEREQGHFKQYALPQGRKLPSLKAQKPEKREVSPAGRTEGERLG